MTETGEPIAVIGIGGRFPGSPDCARFWANLLAGVDSIGPVPGDRWQADEALYDGLDENGRRAMGFGGFIDEIDRFDAGFFGIGAAEAAKMDPKQRLALECAWRTMEDSGLTADQLKATETGVFIGTSVYDYYELLMQDPRNVDGYVGVGNFNCIIPNRISYLLDLRGPSMAIETACSASLTAIHLACQSIRTGECTQAFAGGVMIILSPYVTKNFAKGHFLSPDGRCKTFDASADGYVRGEGVGMVLLKPLSAAQRDGDHVRAIVLATACNQDGRSNGLTAPNPLAQERLLQRAYKAAGVSPGEVGYVEAHGTGTHLGDPIEAKALGRILSEGRPADRPCLVGSVKSNIGHLEAAAGVAGFIKAVLAIEHEAIPPSLHFEDPNPLVAFGRLNLEVPTQVRAWPENARRIAGVSSFSFGGTNAHAVLAEAPAAEEQAALDPWPAEILVLSARSEEALDRLAQDYARALRAIEDPADFRTFCSAASRSRKAYRHRIALVAATAEEAAVALEQSSASVHRGLVGERPRKLAFLFSGQATNLAGAGADLMEFPAFRDAFLECEAAVAGMLDVNLREAIWGERGELLEETRYFQPALMAFSLSLYRLWRSWGVSPAIVLGHSLGEYCAAVAAGVYEQDEAMRLVARRAALMAGSEPGGMMALFCATADAELLLDGRRDVELGGENAPDVTVLTGTNEGLDAVAEAAVSRGIATQRLPSRNAFHSRLMDPVLEALTEAADATPSRAPRIKLISNRTARMLRSAPDGRYWADHARSPVRFAQSIVEAQREGARLFLEIGPGRALTSLVRRAALEEGSAALASLGRPADGRNSVAESLAQLFIAGVAIDWDAVHAGRPRRYEALPGHPFIGERHWFEHVSSRRAVADGPGTSERRWTIDANGRALLTEHRLHGTAVLPAAAFLVYIGATLNEGKGRRMRIGELALLRPIEIPPAGALELAIHLGQTSPDGRRALRVTTGSGEGEVVHARGTVEPGEAAAVADEAEVLRESGADLPPLDISRRYESLSRQGVEYGPMFRTLHRLAGGNGVVLASVGLAAEVGGASLELRLSALLDGCFQALGIDDGKTAFIPTRVGRVEWSDWGRIPAWAAARSREAGGGQAVLADLDIFDADDALVMRIRDLRLQETSAADMAGATAPDDALRSALFAVEWREGPRPGQLDRRPLAALVGDLAEAAAARADDLELRDYTRALDVLDRRTGPAVANALAALGGTAGALAVARTPHARALVERFPHILASNAALPAASAADAALVSRLAGPEERTLARCLEALPRVLDGTIDPLIPLFGEDGGGDVAKIYGEAPVGRYFNALCGSVLQAVAGSAGGDRLRVLEVGAGTCATTEAILAVADGLLDYTVSDHAPAFVAQAQERYAGMRNVSVARVDVERDLDGQGIATGGFDAIVAANVLHATADLDAVLRRLHRALAPGGLLLLVELTRARTWLDLTFGLTSGWWKFGAGRREAVHPLLSRSEWFAQLRRAGFEVDAAPAPDDLGQDLIIARKAQTQPSAAPVWLVTGDESGLGQAIRTELEARGAALAEGADDMRPREGLIHIACEDAGPEQAGVRGLEAAQTVLRAGGRERIVFVTRGSVSTGPADPVTRIGPAALQGLARTMGLEAPEARPLVIDLAADEVEDNAAQAAMVCDEISGRSNEDEVAYRGGIRWMPRLVQAAGGDVLGSPGTHWRLRYGDGGLDAVAAPELQAGAGEVVLRVHYAGLNFLDVLESIGALPFTREEGLGEECFGIVEAVGDGVVSCRPGDRVIAMARGTAASHVRVSADLVAAAPAGIAPRAAATVPVAYATAIHALRDVARLRPGEAVLIHSGASGTGLAAVHYALSVGARVYATASPAKWPMLKRLGVCWTGSSRSTAFADALGAEDVKVDVVLNALTGEGFIAASLGVLAEGGRFVEMAKRNIWSTGAMAESRPDVDYAIVDLYRLTSESPAAAGALLGDAVGMLGRGEIAPLHHRVYPAGEAAAALGAMRLGLHVGKVLLDCTSAHAFAGDGTATFDPESDYLITGAFGGLGQAVAEWMVEHGARRLILAGARLGERADGLKARLEALGCEVELVEADLADAAAAARLAGDAAASGRLRGAIHAVGVLEDGSIANLSDTGFAKVVRPKCVGAEALAERWLRDGHAAAMDFFVLFSSAAALLGSPGQANHAAANAALDAAASAWRARGLRASSINWGAWSHIGAAAEKGAEAFVRQRGMEPISPALGLAAFDWALRHDHVQLAVVPIDWARWTVENRGRPFFEELAASPSEATAPREDGMLESLKAAIPIERRHQLDRFARTVIAEALGHDEERLDFTLGFSDLGVDSLTAVSIRNRLQRELDCKLGTSFLFDYPNLAILVDTLDSGLHVAEAPPSVPPAPPARSETAEDLAQRLEAMLDEAEMEAS
jgi:acyl transferase domain-containing protein/NADPH:quinone reductase-like Zn-dependent oxidoreductase/NADP-dependent 3-hydroxy acid dehydrogenase YdfG/acyl carrier protein